MDPTSEPTIPLEVLEKWRAMLDSQVKDAKARGELDPKNPLDEHLPQHTKRNPSEALKRATHYVDDPRLDALMAATANMEGKNDDEVRAMSRAYNNIGDRAPIPDDEQDVLDLYCDEFPNQ